MNAGQSSARRIASSNVSPGTVCLSCRHRLFGKTSPTSRRNASAAAAVAVEQSSSEQTAYPNPPVTAAGPRKAFRMKCSPVLSRPPLLTRDLTPFEKAYYLYQKRLNERLALPFTRYFYYKKATPAGTEWKRKAKMRRGVASRDVGVYNAYADDGWHDEVMVGSKLGEPEDIYDKLIRDAEGKDIVDAEPQGDAETGGETIGGDAKAGDSTRKPVGEVAVERPMPRLTEADTINDLTSLNRKLDRSLYLVVKREDGTWRFPEDRIYNKENLHQAAERILLQAGGINMNTWVVGNHPIGHYASNFAEPITSQIPRNRLLKSSEAELERQEYGEKVFFMKSRIMAGQADISKNDFGDTEFQWLVKEEVKEKVEAGNKEYWRWIKNMLTDR